jgi:hypothetical protein
MYSDDNCSRALLDIDSQTSCHAWNTVLGGMPVWSIRVEGRCRNIADRNYTPQVCEQFQHSGNVLQRRMKQPDAIELFTDDSCARELTHVQRGDDCSAMNGVYGDAQVWSIRFRGRCENIPDTNFPSACQNYSR